MRTAQLDAIAKRNVVSNESSNKTLLGRRMGTYCSIPLTSPPWYATFFLDPGIKWCHVEFGSIEFIHATPWVALAFIVSKSFIERCIAGPLGEWLNVKDKSYSCPSRQSVLEKAYTECPRPGQEMLRQLSADVNWTPYRVYKWFTRKRHCGKPSQLTKFKETFWRLIAQTVTSVFGLYLLAQENFFWDLSKCYLHYPANVPSWGVMAYWTVELAFYIATLMCHRYDPTKSDCKLLLVHYLLMVLMLSLSYFINTIQIAVLMIFLHNIADVPLELAKLLKYSHCESQTKFAFLMFGVVYFLTRIVLYPSYLLYSAIFQFPVISSHPPAYWMFIGTLSLTQLLHLYWFKLIVVMFWSLLSVKGTESEVVQSDTADLSPPLASPQTYTHEEEDDAAHWCSRVYESHTH